MTLLRIQNLQVRLARTSVTKFDQLLAPDADSERHTLKASSGLSGIVHVARASSTPPDWVRFVQDEIDGSLAGLLNRSNGAVLMIEAEKRIFAFTFGHGRHLLRDELPVPDFGFITALNGLEPTSLRSVDTRTVDERPLTRRVQTSEEANFMEFGVEIDRDMLRAVTGTPKKGTELESLTGSDYGLSIGVRTDMKSLPNVCKRLLDLYKDTSYRAQFGFVDNMKVVVDRVEEGKLWEKAATRLQDPTLESSLLSPPVVIDWAQHGGFRLTRGKNIHHTVGLSEYRATFKDLSEITSEKLKSDRLKAYHEGDDEAVDEWPVFRCLNLEIKEGQNRFLSSGGRWYEIKEDFVKRIAARVAQIPRSKRALPEVKIAGGKVEAEGPYNERAAKAAKKTLALMDKKLARCAAAGSDIEVCDLFTDDGAFIHVKHRKGGSSTLSHLFAQARVSAEALVSDHAFRKAARSHLHTIGKEWSARLNDRGFDARKHTVVLAFLNCTAKGLQKLPFFSQLNLVRTYDAMTRLGYGVELLAIPAK